MLLLSLFFGLLGLQCDDKEERDRLLMFIDKLLFHQKNVKLFLDASGVKLVVDLITLAHLHVSRAHVPLQVRVYMCVCACIDGSCQFICM